MPVNRHPQDELCSSQAAPTMRCLPASHYAVSSRCGSPAASFSRPQGPGMRGQLFLASAPIVLLLALATSGRLSEADGPLPRAATVVVVGAVFPRGRTAHRRRGMVPCFICRKTELAVACCMHGGSGDARASLLAATLTVTTPLTRHQALSTPPSMPVILRSDARRVHPPPSRSRPLEDTDRRMA